MGITPSRRPFYAHWVRQFFKRFLKHRRRDLGHREITTFLNQLRDDPAIAHWQITQAKDAIEVYYEQFLGTALEPEKEQTCAGKDLKLNKTEESRIPAPRELTQQTHIPPPIKKKRSPRVDMNALEKAAKTAFRIEHYALKTERSYIQWIRRFVRFHHYRRPAVTGLFR